MAWIRLNERAKREWEKSQAERDAKVEEIKKRDEEFREKANLIYDIDIGNLQDDITDFTNRYNTISSSWQNTDTMSAYKQDADNIYNRLNSYKQYIQKYESNNENYNEMLSNADKLLNEYSKGLDSITNIAKTYEQFKNADEYETAVKNNQYLNKYSGKTYADIKNILNTSKQLTEDEQKWLNSYQYEVMTEDEINKELSSIEANVNSLREQIKKDDAISGGSQKQLMPNSMTAEQKAAFERIQQNTNKINELSSLEQLLKTNLAQKTQLREFEEKWKESAGKKGSVSYENPFDKYAEDLGIGLNDQEFAGYLTNKKYFDLMTEDEKNSYDWIMENKGEDQALEYFNDLADARLDKRYNEEIIKNTFNYASSGGWQGALSTLGSVVTSLSSGLEYAVNTLSGNSDRRSTFSSMTSGLREGTKSNWEGAWGEDVWDFLYDTSTSALDSLTAAGISVVTTPAVGAAVLGGSAAASTANDLLDRGATGGQVVLGSVAAGVFEGLFEKVSLGNLKSLATKSAPEIIKELGWSKAGVKNLAKEIGKTVFVNASEEMNTEIANIIYDGLMNGELSQYATTVQQYVSEGDSIQDAKRKASQEITEQVVTAGLSGGLMGFGFGGLGVASAGINNARENISNRSSRLSDSAVKQLISEGLSAEQNSQFYKISSDLSNKKVTAADAGRLKNAALDYSANKTSEALYSSIQKTARERLSGLGMDSDSLDTAVSAVAKSYSGEALTDSESNILKSDSRVTDVLNEFKSSDNVSDNSNGDVGSNLMESVYNDEGYRAAQQAEQRIKNIVNENMTLVSAQEQTGTSSGNADDNINSDFTGDSEADINSYAQNYGTLSKQFIDTFNLQPTDDVAEFAAGYDIAYTYGTIDGISLDYALNSQYTSMLSPEQIEAAYMAGKSEKASERQNIGTQKYRISQKKGIVRLDDSINFNSLSEKQKASLRAIRKLAELTGIDFEFFSSRTNEKGEYIDENGSYYDGVIRLDINAGKNSVFSGEVAILSVASHELTHYLREYNKEAYRELQSFILEHLNGYNGKSLDDFVNNKMEQYKKQGKEISYPDAVEEVVADACSEMLKNSTALKTLAEQNKSLFNKIVNFLKQLFADIKKAYQNTVLTEEAKAMMSYMDELQKLWDKALIGAVENSRGKGAGNKSNNKKRAGGSENTNIKFSFEGRNKDGIEVYTTNEDIKNLPYAERKRIFLRLMKNEFARRTAKFKKNGETYYALFKNEDVRKSIYGDKRSSPSGYKAKINVGASGNVFELVENSKYSSDKPEEGKSSRAHKNIEFWDYFIKTVEIDGELFDILADVRRSKTNQYVYSIRLIESNKKRTSLPTGVENSSPLRLGTRRSINSISQKNENVNKKIKNSLRNNIDAYENLNETKRLTDRITKLESDVSKLRELLKLTKTVTNDKVLNPAQLRKVADIIRKNANSTLSVDKLALQLRDLYGRIMSDKEITWQDIVAAATPIAENLVSNMRNVRIKNDYISQLVKDIQQLRFSLSPDQLAEVENAYGSYGEYRKRNMGKFNVSSSATELNKIWQDMAEKYPDIFNKNVSESDRPLKLIEIYEDAKDTATYIAEFDRNEVVQSIISDIYDKFWDVSTLETFADKKQKQINALKAKHKQQIKDLKANFSEKDKRTRQYYKDKLSAVIANKNEKINETARLGRERLAEHRQRLAKTATIEKIRTRLNEFGKMLAKPTVKKHIPSNCVQGVADLLEAFTYNTKRERAVSDYLTRFKEDYDDMKRSENPVYDENISTAIEEFSRKIRGKTLREMSIEELNEAYDLIKMVSKWISGANKLFNYNKNLGVEEIANDIIRSFIPKTKSERIERGKLLRGIKEFGWNLLKPAQIFKTIGSKRLTELYEDLRRSEDIWANDIYEAREFYLKAVQDFGYKKFDKDAALEFSTISGKIKLNLEQRMFLYAASKRQQYLKHLQNGGFVYSDDVTFENDRGNKKVAPSKTPHPLSLADIENIVNSLTDNQKAFVDRLQGYLSNEMSQKGNEVTRALYDIDRFREKNYWPIISDKNYLVYYPHKDNEQTSRKESGFTKDTVENASNPVILGEFSDVFGKHVNNMASYHATVLPLENLNRVLGYKRIGQEGELSKSVRTSIENVYGKPALTAINDLLKDVNGGIKRSTNQMGLVRKALSNFKKTAVFMSASVAIQQPSSIARASKYINLKYLARTMTQKRNYEELMKYAPIAKVKKMGYFDTSIGQPVVDWIINLSPETTSEKLKALFGKDSNFRDEIFSKLPEKMDELTWAHIWNAVKLEVKESGKYKVGSEEYFKACGDRFTEIVTNTQVYDSVFSRPGVMRAGDGLMDQITAFMSEPLTSLNMLIDGIIEGKRIGGKAGAEYLAKSVGAFVLAGVYNSLLVSFVRAARDDDDEKTYIDKYIGEFYNSLLDSLNPLSLIPLVRDIVSVFEGYDVSRNDMSSITKLADAAKTWGSEDKGIYDKVNGTVDAISSFFGLPFGNISRDIESIFNVFIKSKPINETSWQGIKEAMFGEQTAENKTKEYGALINNGNSSKAKDYLNSLLNSKEESIKKDNPDITDKEAAKKAKSALKSSFTSYYKQLYINGDANERNKIRIIMGKSGLYGNSSDVQKTCKEWLEDENN
jgi:hypothetical protein|nr:MAG TPA: hypothetical protein [Caudoviricetes sp.]